MTELKTAAKSVAGMAFAETLNKALAFLAFAYLARQAGPESFGVISIALAVTTLSMMLSDLGVNAVIVREVARNKGAARAIMGRLVALKALLAIATLAVIVAAAGLLGYDAGTASVIYLMAAAMFLSSFTEFFNAFFQGLGMPEHVARARVLNGAVLLAGVLLSSHYYGGDLYAFSYAFIAASLLPFAYSAAAAAKNIGLDWKGVSIAHWVKALREGMPFALSFIFATVFYWTDSVMLSVMSTSEVVGWYNAAYRLILAVLILRNAFDFALYPAMSRLYERSREGLGRASNQYLNVMILVCIPLGVGTTVMAEDIVGLVFGQDYGPAADALKILIWASSAIFVSGVFGRFLEASNKAFTVTKVMAFCAVENIALNLAVIPVWGYLGASATTVVTELTSLSLLAWCVGGLNDWKAREKLVLAFKALLASLVMGAFIHYYEAPFPLEVLAGILVYALAATIVSAIKPEDWRLLRFAVKQVITR